MNTATVSRLLLLAAAVLFSTGGAAIKACSLNATQVASFRSGIAALALLAFLPQARKRWTWRTVAVAFAYAATLTTFVMANKMTTSANAIFLQATAPIYLLALGPLVLRERVRAVDAGVIAVVGAGAILIFLSSQQPLATAPSPARGNLLGLASGLAWALTVAGLRWLEKREAVAGAAIMTVTAGNVVAFAVNLPMALPVASFTAADFGVLLYLGVFQIGLAYWCLSRSIRHVPALESATLLMAEPALNPLWTWIVEGENPGFEAVAGGIAILAATLFGTWWSARKKSNQLDA